MSNIDAHVWISIMKPTSRHKSLKAIKNTTYTAVISDIEVIKNLLDLVMNVSV
jgi:hypothetical protein